MINKKIEALSRKILMNFNMYSVKDINLRTICEHNDIILKEEKLEHDISGLLILKNDNTYILYNENENIRRQKFTIAHELGHFYLHKDSQMFVDTEKILYRNNESNKGEIKKEIEANCFAASLLMPEHFINDEIKKLNKDITIDDIEILAETFDVSIQAMTFRLANLGYYL